MTFVHLKLHFVVAILNLVFPELNLKRCLQVSSRVEELTGASLKNNAITQSLKRIPFRSKMAKPRHDISDKIMFLVFIDPILALYGQNGNVYVTV